MLGTNTLTSGAGSESAVQYDYRDTIAASQKVNWQVEDIIGGDKKLDFSKRFMPEALARVEELNFLNDDEKRILNQIRANTYLSIFVIVEEFIVPFVLDHVRPSLDQDDYRVRAFLQFAGEEVKHIQLFKTFCEEFRAGFKTECKVIGPASEIGKAILSHDPLSVALVILMIEWLTQAHYVDSMKDNGDIDPQFKSLLKNHWLEEAQHAKLDTRMVESLAEGLSSDAIEKAVDALELATGRVFSASERDTFIEVQLQANRWTYIGSGMVHPKFLKTMDRLGVSQRKRIDEAGPLFA